MASGSVAPSFFVDHKRGEVNELKMLLNNPKLLRELDKKREVIKKVSPIEWIRIAPDRGPDRIGWSRPAPLAHRDGYVALRRRIHCGC